ncbi:MAG TPA: MoaD/ThiS family protein [Arcobacter sp.]|nr:MoaD/ThiS family protein [Arcobacter sp.]
MVKVEFLGPINIDPMELDVTNLIQLSQCLQENQQLAKWLESCAVAVNDVIINDKSIILKSGDKVSLLPPVCGG